MIDVIYHVVLVVLAVGTTAFPISYHIGTGGQWRRTQMGRHLMGYTTAAALLADAGIVRVFFPDLPGQEIGRLAALALAAIFVWQRNIIFVRAQRERDTERTS